MKNLLFITIITAILGLTIKTSVAQCNAVGNGTDGGILCMYDDSANGWLYVGGGFITSGSDTLYNCGAWNDTGFYSMGMMGNYGTNDSVWCYTFFNGNVYVGGSFTTAGGITVNHIAMWDGNTWHAVGSGFNGTVHSLAVYNNALYAGGEFSGSGSASVKHIAKWNGTQWNQVDGDVNGDVDAMCRWGNALYLAGDFTQAGSITVNHICKWNDTTFSALGSGFSSTMMMMPCMVQSLAVYNGSLYAGGAFNHAGGTGMNNIAKWNGSSWSSIGNIGAGMGSDIVSSLCEYDGQLYVGGNFGACGSTSSNNIGVWNGSVWSTIGTGMNGIVKSMVVYYNKLYLGGAFTNAAGTTVSNIASYSKLTGIQQVNAPGLSSVVYPNPAAGSYITCKWQQTTAETVTLSLFNLAGEKVYEKNIINAPAGANSKTLNICNLGTGVYLYIIKGSGTQYTGKFSIFK